MSHVPEVDFEDVDVREGLDALEVPSWVVTLVKSSDVVVTIRGLEDPEALETRVPVDDVGEIPDFSSSVFSSVPSVSVVSSGRTLAGPISRVAVSVIC